jgi:F-type H+-transporting ATPase subunit delta
MKHQMLAQRYARALYALAKDHNEQDAVFAQMRVINSAFQNDKEVAAFLQSPLIRPAEKVQALEKLTASLNISPLLKTFLLLLGKKGRLGIFDAIQSAFQRIADEEYGVTRGTVRSATVLPPEERKRLETLVGRATRKQVILSYTEDPELLGGMVAEVGSFTFDDSLTSHLKRMNEQLTRSTH